MIQTFTTLDGGIVQAMRLTGTESSARKLCKWLSISKWAITYLGAVQTFTVTIPSAYFSGDGDERVGKGDWVVCDSQYHLTIYRDDAEFTSHYTRL